MIEPGDALERAFPTAEQVPSAFRYVPDDTGLALLTRGRVQRWSGPTEAIRSAVCLKTAEGHLVQADLGPAPVTTAAEGRAAVESAAEAWAGGRGDWPRASVEARISCVEAFVARARLLRERVSLALMWEVGKPYADCLVEFDRTIQYIEDTVERLRELERDNGPAVAASGFSARVRRAPLGVALCMGPYNYAVNEVFTLVIPALIMGNPVVMKTPRYGVLANAHFVPALAESFPPGVVNLVTGPGPTVVGPMMESGLVDVLAFVGSARTARILQTQHPAPYRLRWVLGLGAKNVGIVLEDADLDLAAKEIVSGALTFSGQRCTAIKHVRVARSVAAPLVERLAAAVSRLGVGMPWEDGVVVTPMPDPQHPAFLHGLVTDAVARGGRVVNEGGGARCATIFRPALVYPVARAAELAHAEQFGPVVPVTPFDDPDEVLADLAASDVGQQAAVFGSDPVALGRLVDHLANLVCRVNINTQCRRGPDVFPFTGRKGSALGTLSVYDALRTFSVRSLVAVARKDESLLARLGGTSTFLAPPLAARG